MVKQFNIANNTITGKTKMALIRRVGPREAYITHMSHEIGLHAETEALLPAGVHLAYDTLEIEIKEEYENTQR